MRTYKAVAFAASMDPPGEAINVIFLRGLDDATKVKFNMSSATGPCTFSTVVSQEIVVLQEGGMG